VTETNPQTTVTDNNTHIKDFIILAFPIRQHVFRAEKDFCQETLTKLAVWLVKKV